MRKTVLHECEHSFSLPHIFMEARGKLKVSSSHVFYKGYTDNYMDYEWQKGKPVNPSDLSKDFYSSRANKFKGNMLSLCKWQWEIVRKDRSLITNY